MGDFSNIYKCLLDVEIVVHVASNTSYPNMNPDLLNLYSKALVVDETERYLA